MESLEKNLKNEQINKARHIRYPQPYHIRINLYNEALNFHLRQKEHRRMKYLAHKENKEF